MPWQLCLWWRYDFKCGIIVIKPLIKRSNLFALNYLYICKVTLNNMLYADKEEFSIDKVIRKIRLAGQTRLRRWKQLLLWSRMGWQTRSTKAGSLFMGKEQLPRCAAWFVNV